MKAALAGLGKRLEAHNLIRLENSEFAKSGSGADIAGAPVPYLRFPMIASTELRDRIYNASKGWRAR